MKKILLVMVCLLALMGCNEEKKIIIAEQYGLAYAPVQVMMSQKILEEKLPDYTIEWVKLGNTMAIREAMTADALDVAFLGIPPYIIGTDKGMEWKLFTGLSKSPLALMGKKETTLKDITQDQKIALPQPGSIQHILLSMAAERELGDATYFDDQLVTMKHPDGMAMLINGEDIDFHFTSPPYLFEEKSAGMVSVIDGNECFGGDFTFIAGVTTAQFKGDEKAYKAVVEAVNEAIAFIENNPEETLELLGEYYDLDKDVLNSYLYESGIIFENGIDGVETFVDFMYRNGYIEKQYTREDLVW